MNPIFQNLRASTDSTPRSGGNSFFVALASKQAGPKPETPLHKFRSHLSELQTIAKAGDVTAWNQQLPRVSLLAEAAHISLEDDLSTRVELTKMEMTLLLQAGKRAKSQEVELRRQAQELRGDDPQRAEEILKKAERLLAMAEKLDAQLLKKTA